MKKKFKDRFASGGINTLKFKYKKNGRFKTFENGGFKK